MTPGTLDSLIARMTDVLGDPAIADCANRQGNRAKSADLLEDAFVALTEALAPDLSVEIISGAIHFN